MELQVPYCVCNSNLNHTGVYAYAKGKVMIHLTFDYQSDNACHTPGEYLRYHRTFQGKSTREVAESVGIVPATLVLYENDKHPIKYNTAVSLAKELNIYLNRLLNSYTSFVDYPCGEFLKKVRKDLSLSQAEIAKDIGVSQTSYSGWERRSKVPRRQEYQKIVSALQRRKIDVSGTILQSIV